MGAARYRNRPPARALDAAERTADSRRRTRARRAAPFGFRWMGVWLRAASAGANELTARIWGGAITVRIWSRFRGGVDDLRRIRIRPRHSTAREEKDFRQLPSWRRSSLLQGVLAG